MRVLAPTASTMSFPLPSPVLLFSFLVEKEVILLPRTTVQLTSVPCLFLSLSLSLSSFLLPLMTQPKVQYS